MAGIRKAITVYILDDDESVRRSLLRLLGAAGFEAVAFDAAESFLLHIPSVTPPGCLLLDITMPHMSGLQVVQRMRAMGVSVPVIAVSARDDNETRCLAHQLGAKLFLGKPVDDRALIDAIQWVAADS